VIRRYFVILASLSVVATCRPHTSATPSPASPASIEPDSADPRRAEYEVYAFVLAQLDYEVDVADETHEAWRCIPTSPSVCDSRRIPAEFTEALRDYEAKGVAPTPLPRRPAPARPLAPWRVPRGGEPRCWPKPTASLSRVGFSPDGRRAVISYAESTGPGPYPGCGYTSSRLLLLRREAQGEWRVEALAAEWIT